MFSKQTLKLGVAGILVVLGALTGSVQASSFGNDRVFERLDQIEKLVASARNQNALWNSRQRLVRLISEAKAEIVGNINQGVDQHVFVASASGYCGAYPEGVERDATERAVSKCINAGFLSCEKMGYGSSELFQSGECRYTVRVVGTR